MQKLSTWKCGEFESNAIMINMQFAMRKNKLAGKKERKKEAKSVKIECAESSPLLHPLAKRAAHIVVTREIEKKQ